MCSLRTSKLCFSQVLLSHRRQQQHSPAMSAPMASAAESVATFEIIGPLGQAKAARNPLKELGSCRASAAARSHAEASANIQSAFDLRVRSSDLDEHEPDRSETCLEVYECLGCNKIARNPLADLKLHKHETKLEEGVEDDLTRTRSEFEVDDFDSPTIHFDLDLNGGENFPAGRSNSAEIPITKAQRAELEEQGTFTRMLSF
mmetsp:Transcript_41565/g.97679  ORF Transcript_41565/g.97679 Transcript_41565/m.97679 type:complete len:203 (+) Transcript_41565:1-609(+)